MFNLKSLILLSFCCTFNGCISTQVGNLDRAKGLDHKQKQHVTYQGQFLTDILGIFIEQQTGLSSAFVLGITNATTINYVDRKFEKIERYKEEEYLLKKELLTLKEELKQIKIEYLAVKKSLRNMENLRESRRRELKSLNSKYKSRVAEYKNKLSYSKNYVMNSNKIRNKKSLLKIIRESQNELRYL
ncbi:MAG TPA: hypothetical protein EYG85_12345 [Crocinitomix sp.]|nr:hypothetical protein [Crocinitomix sp.]